MRSAALGLFRLSKRTHIEQRTVLAALKDGLPSNVALNVAEEARTKVSNTESAKLTEVCKAIRMKPVDSYKQKGLEYLEALESSIEGVYAPASVSTPNLNHATEGDVVASYLQHVLNPIVVVLETLIAGNSALYFEVKCEHKTESGDNRVDFIFLIANKVQKTKPQAFAIIEIKKRGIIKSAIPEFEKSVIEEYEALPKETKLKSSAKNLTNQATRYAYGYQCQHIALFDWDNLMLLDFIHLAEVLKSRGGKNNDEPFAGEVMDTTNVDKPKQISIALLGFIIKGLELRLETLGLKKDEDHSHHHDRGHGHHPDRGHGHHPKDPRDDK